MAALPRCTPTPGAPAMAPERPWAPPGPAGGACKGASAHPGHGHACSAEGRLGGDDGGHLGSLCDEGTGTGAGGGPS